MPKKKTIEKNKEEKKEKNKLTTIKFYPDGKKEEVVLEKNLFDVAVIPKLWPYISAYIWPISVKELPQPKHGVRFLAQQERFIAKKEPVGQDTEILRRQFLLVVVLSLVQNHGIIL